MKAIHLLALQAGAALAVGGAAEAQAATTVIGSSGLIRRAELRL